VADISILTALRVSIVPVLPPSMTNPFWSSE
jgi:hypothetical protein